MDFVLYILTFVFGAVVGFLAARRGEERQNRRICQRRGGCGKSGSARRMLAHFGAACMDAHRT